MKTKYKPRRNSTKDRQSQGLNGKASTLPRIRTPEEILADWWWLLLEADSAELTPYQGKHIAVVDKKILGSKRNSIQLRSAIAKQHQLDPESVVIYFVG